MTKDLKAKKRQVIWHHCVQMKRQIKTQTEKQKEQGKKLTNRQHEQVTSLLVSLCTIGMDGRGEREGDGLRLS